MHGVGSEVQGGSEVRDELTTSEGGGAGFRGFAVRPVNLHIGVIIQVCDASAPIVDDAKIRSVNPCVDAYVETKRCLHAGSFQKSDAWATLSKFLLPICCKSCNSGPDNTNLSPKLSIISCIFPSFVTKGKK